MHNKVTRIFKKSRQFLDPLTVFAVLCAFFLVDVKSKELFPHHGRLGSSTLSKRVGECLDPFRDFGQLGVLLLFEIACIT